MTFRPQRLIALLVVTLASSFGTAIGCAGGDGDGDGDGDGACVSGESGRWAGGDSTDCFGMPMDGDATFDGCTLTFSNWNMEMSVPTGATIDGAAMQFTGEDWSACTGTLADDGKSFTATCPDEPACDFAMAKEE